LKDKLAIPAKRYGKATSLMLKSKITPAPIEVRLVLNSCGSRLESPHLRKPALPKALKPKPLFVQAGKKYSIESLPR